MLLHSDVARLVLGYLAEENCTQAYEIFLKESQHLKGMRHAFSQDVQTQQNYRTKYGRDPPSCPFDSFMEAWTVFDAWRNGRPRASEENIDCVRKCDVNRNKKMEKQEWQTCLVDEGWEWFEQRKAATEASESSDQDSDETIE